MNIVDVKQALCQVFPVCRIHTYRDRDSTTATAFVINNRTVHQIHITVPPAHLGSHVVCQWQEETGEYNLDHLCADDPSPRLANTFRETRHIFCARNPAALQGWLARTRHHIPPESDIDPFDRNGSQFLGGRP